MFKYILSAILATLLLLGIFVDSAHQTAPPTTPTPHSRMSTTEHFANEPQHVYRFSGAADGVRLEDGRIVLNDNIAGNDIEVFEGGFLTVDANDITAYSYEYTVTIEGDMVYTLTAGTISGDGTTFGIINQPMGIDTATQTLYKDRNIHPAELINTLTFALNLTHVDGSVSTHILPLSVEKAEKTIEH